MTVTCVASRDEQLLKPDDLIAYFRNSKKFCITHHPMCAIGTDPGSNLISRKITAAHGG